MGLTWEGSGEKLREWETLKLFTLSLWRLDSKVLGLQSRSLAVGHGTIVGGDARLTGQCSTE